MCSLPRKIMRSFFATTDNLTNKTLQFSVVKYGTIGRRQNYCNTATKSVKNLQLDTKHFKHNQWLLVIFSGFQSNFIRPNPHVHSRINWPPTCANTLVSECRKWRLLRIRQKNAARCLRDNLRGEGAATVPLAYLDWAVAALIRAANATKSDRSRLSIRRLAGGQVRREEAICDDIWRIDATQPTTDG